MRLSSCFPCFSSPLVPPNHTELSREELKGLYELSLPLNNGRLIVHGIFARADTRNNNKRVYPKAILKREVAKYEAEHISQGTALGELDHPNYASRYFKCLNLANMSHQVLDVEWRSDQLWGTIEILPTPSGLLLWELYGQGIRLGVSSRGWASLRTDDVEKCVYVDDDFELITFDFVTEPSTSGAYLVPIRKQYKRPLPDQKKCTQVGHLGYGAVAMKNVGRLPEPRVLAECIAKMRYEVGGASLKAPPAAAGGAVSRRKDVPNNLDKLLKFSHYIVHADAVFLDREANARDYRSHLIMFATRAHLSDQTLLAREDINAVILQEMTLGGGDIILMDQQWEHAMTPGAAGAEKGAPLNDSVNDPSRPELQPALLPSPPSNDLGSWAMHPNALFVDGAPVTPVRGDTNGGPASTSGSATAPSPPALPPTRLNSNRSATSLAPSAGSVLGPSGVSFRHKAAVAAASEVAAGAGGSGRRDAGGTAAAGGSEPGDSGGGGGGTGWRDQRNHARSASDAQYLAGLSNSGGVVGPTGGTAGGTVTSTAVAVAAGVQSTSTEVAQEFLRINATLARFTSRYQAGQVAVQAALSLAPPSTQPATPSRSTAPSR